MTDLSTVAASKGLELLFKIATENGGKLLGVVANTAFKLKGDLAVNFSDYFDSSISRCSRVSILFDRNKSADLFSLYVRTYLSRSGSTLADVKFRDTITAQPAGGQRRIFLITGSAGSGKTFLLRWLFLTLIENQSLHIPFYIELRNFNQHKTLDFREFLYETVLIRLTPKITISSVGAEMRCRRLAPHRSAISGFSPPVPTPLS